MYFRKRWNVYVFRRIFRFIISHVSTNSVILIVYESLYFLVVIQKTIAYACDRSRSAELVVNIDDTYVTSDRLPGSIIFVYTRSLRPRSPIQVFTYSLSYFRLSWRSWRYDVKTARITLARTVHRWTVILLAEKQTRGPTGPAIKSRHSVRLTMSFRRQSRNEHSIDNSYFHVLRGAFSETSLSRPVRLVHVLRTCSPLRKRT